MPYKSEKIKIAGTKLDKRCKLSQDQKDAIVLLSKEKYSQRKLAEMFGCSKRSVQNILKPQKRSPPKKMPTEYWTERKKLYRKRKQQLFLDGLIKQK